MVRKLSLVILFVIADPASTVEAVELKQEIPIEYRVEYN